MPTAFSVVVPAHNEAATIARALRRLQAGLDDAVLDVVVACNGCTDDTAAVARKILPAATVLDLPQPSKIAAVAAGNAVAGGFPRVHLDADVELSGSAALALARALAEPGVLAVAPRRLIPRDECPLVVRWYHDVWEALPAARHGLFGRGAFMLSEEGQRRVDAQPRLLNDDLAASEAFEAHERRIVEDATVIVHPPRTLRGLIARRIRVVTGVAQADRLGVRRPGGGNSLRDVVRLVRSRPWMAPRAAVFVLVTLLARIAAQRAVHAGDFHTWRRDESTRVA